MLCQERALHFISWWTCIVAAGLLVPADGKLLAAVPGQRVSHVMHVLSVGC